MNAPTEVSDFELALDTNKEVLWFNVPMDNVLFVEVVERICHLRDVLQEIRDRLLLRSSRPTRLERRSENRPCFVSCLYNSP